MDESVQELRELMTLDELCNRVGMRVRNIRFYTTRGLVPPPIRRGRSGYYSADHLVRLELVKELQAHGFTLSAIERYVARIPEEASPADIALHRTLLAPWMAEHAEVVTKAELYERAGRKLSRDDLETLEALGVIARTGRQRYGWRLRTSRSRWAWSTWASRPRLPSPRRRCTPSTGARSPRRSPRCSEPRCGRRTRRRACRPSSSRTSSSA